MLDGGYRFGEPTIRVTAVEQQSRLMYVGNLPGEVPDATKRAFFLSPFEDSFWWFHRVLLQGLASSRCLWRNRRKTSPHLVASPASRFACGTVASRVFARPAIQRPWSSPSAMPTQPNACAGDVAMLTMTVAKPGAADQFRCQRRVFLKVVLRVPMLVPL